MLDTMLRHAPSRTLGRVIAATILVLIVAACSAGAGATAPPASHTRPPVVTLPPSGSPSSETSIVPDELRRRFGLPFWQFTVTATDANRFAIRLAREITGRPKVLVHDHNYHGSVDSTNRGKGPAHFVIQFIGTPSKSEPRARSQSARERGLASSNRAISASKRRARRVRSSSAGAGIVAPVSVAALGATRAPDDAPRL